MDAVSKVLHKIRQIPRRIKIVDPMDVRLVEAEALAIADDQWEKDVALVRSRNFVKAQAALQEKRELQQEMKLREMEIHEMRLKNLKKARRKLARMREDGR